MPWLDFEGRRCPIHLEDAAATSTLATLYHNYRFIPSRLPLSEGRDQVLLKFEILAIRVESDTWVGVEKPCGGQAVRCTPGSFPASQAPGPTPPHPHSAQAQLTPCPNPRQFYNGKFLRTKLNPREEREELLTPLFLCRSPQMKPETCPRWLLPESLAALPTRICTLRKTQESLVHGVAVSILSEEDGNETSLTSAVTTVSLDPSTPPSFTPGPWCSSKRAHLRHSDPHPLGLTGPAAVQDDEKVQTPEPRPCDKGLARPGSSPSPKHHRQKAQQEPRLNPGEGQGELTARTVRCDYHRKIQCRTADTSGVQTRSPWGIKMFCSIDTLWGSEDGNETSLTSAVTTVSLDPSTPPSFTPGPWWSV
ncbi:hypothetical protein SUZIE_195760 [Sciurus carolinensis]|uniref:Uncharacterized protein n=1 Tax=Sciurus carolinensis TaxID=30640 RepID=A0AA41T8V3_SCICA|nr:hypothetical protein [Sciurus carolinensis]